MLAAIVTENLGYRRWLAISLEAARNDVRVSQLKKARP